MGEVIAADTVVVKEAMMYSLSSIDRSLVSRSYVPNYEAQGENIHNSVARIGDADRPSLMNTEP